MANGLGIHVNDLYIWRFFRLGVPHVPANLPETFWFFPEIWETHKSWKQSNHSKDLQLYRKKENTQTLWRYGQKMMHPSQILSCLGKKTVEVKRNSRWGMPRKNSQWLRVIGGGGVLANYTHWAGYSFWGIYVPFLEFRLVLKLMTWFSIFLKC